jgi:hypothetical protein
MDDFTLAPTPAAEPFNLGTVGAATPPFVSPQTSGAPRQAGPPASMDRQQLLKLAIMLPLAMKAGPGAVQGLMAGFAQHAQQQYQQGRQTAADQRAQQQQTATQQYQQGQLANQRETQQRQFLGDFTKGLEGLDTPDAIDAYTKLYAAQGQRMGLDPAALTQYAQPYREPTRLQQRAAEKYVGKLKSEYGDKWMDTAAQFTHRVGGQTLTFDQLLAQAGMARDPNAPMPAPKAAAAPNTPEEQFYQVFASEQVNPTTGQPYGSFAALPTALQLRARERWSQSGRQGETEGEAVDLSGNGLDMAAKMYALTGQLPPMGMGRAGATVRGRIINRAAQYNPTTGQFDATAAPNVAGNAATYKANAAALRQITGNLNAVEAFERTANQNAKLLEAVLTKLPDSGSSVVNRPLRALAGAMGSQDIATFNAIRLSLQNEYGRLISNPNLTGVMSDAARAEAEQALSPNATVGQLRAALLTLQQESQNRRDAFRAQRDEIQRGLSGTPARPAGAPGANPFRR